MNIENKEKSRVLVTGADGLLGSHIVRRLLQSGKYTVRAFMLPNSKADTLDDLSIERSFGNILQYEEVKHAMLGCDYVIHSAALTDAWPDRSSIIWKVNMEGTQHVAKAVMELGLARMVHIGSASSFDPGTREAPADETAPFTRHQYGLDYVDSKQAARLWVLEKARSGELPALIVHPTFMFGEYDSKPGPGEMLLALYHGKMPFLAPGGKNFVYAGDVAQAAVNALQQGETGQEYIAGNENLTYKELGTIVGNTMQVKTPKRILPATIILLAGTLGSRFSALTGKKPKLSLPMARVACDGQYFTPARARQHLSMPATPVQEAVQRALVWLTTK